MPRVQRHDAASGAYESNIDLDHDILFRPLAAAVVASLPLGSRELGVKGVTSKSISLAGGSPVVVAARSALVHRHMGVLAHTTHHGNLGFSISDESQSRILQLGSRFPRQSFGDDDFHGASASAALSSSMLANAKSAVPTRLACAALDALAECVLVLGSRARSVVYTPRILSPLFDALLDRSSSRKREPAVLVAWFLAVVVLTPPPAGELALKVLGRLASSGGCVVAPYLEHPPLLPRMLAVLRENYGGPSSIGSTSRGGMPWSLCREALRALGLVGALDPYKFELVQRGAQDCRRHAARLAYTARDNAIAQQNLQEEVALRIPVPLPVPHNNGASQPIHINTGQADAGTHGSATSTPGTTLNNTLASRPANPNEPPLLAPHVAALLEDDEDEPAHAAMYAQSCAVALPVVKEEPLPLRKLAKRDTMGLLEATGMNAGELAIDGAMRGDDVDAYYFLAHIVMDDDASRDAAGERDDDLFGDKAAHTKRRKVRMNTTRAITPGAGELSRLFVVLPTILHTYSCDL